MAKDDYVDIPGVTPITPASFPPGTPPNPGPAPAAAAPGAPIPGAPPSAGLPAPGGPAMPAPAGPIPSMPFSPLNPQAGVQADAQVYASMADTHRKIGDALSQGKLDEAARHDQFAREQELSLGDSKEQWNKALADQAEREKRMDAAIARGKSMNIDPNNYWNRQGTAANILSAISVGLGSFGSGMTHGATGNPALTMVNNAIDHDIASQKDNIDNYWKGLVQQGHVDDNAFNRSLTTQNLMSNMRLAGFKVYESDLKNIQAKTDSQFVKLGAQKQIDDARLIMNAERKQLSAINSAQAAAGAAQMTKDSETFSKDTMEYMKEHPNLTPSEAARDVAAINPARTARLGSRSALPTEVQGDFVAGKEQGYAGAFNKALKEVTDHNISEYEGKVGRKATDEDKALIRQQTAQGLLQKHPEFTKFQYFKPTVGGGLIDVRPPPADRGAAGQAGDRRNKEQISKDQERAVYVDQPVLDASGQPQVGTDGKPVMHKVQQLAVTKEAADRYIKWSNAEPTVKQQLVILKEALAKGDRASYDGARGALIEKLPSLYGFERGPSSAQVEHTFKDLIPEWTSLPDFKQVANGGQKEYMGKQLAQAENEIDSLATDMRTNTFGPAAGNPRPVASYGPKTPGANAPAPVAGPISPSESPLSIGGKKETVIGGRTYVQDPNTGLVTIKPVNYDFQKKQ